MGDQLQEIEAEQTPDSGGPTLGTVGWLLALAWGAAIASYPLTDNSFLTHLATGRLILEDGAVPSSDPYTFTAPGVDWTVQSWLPSVVYAAAERAGGVVGLRVVVLVLFLVAAGLLWRLSRPCTSLVPRIALVFGSLYVVTDLWGERPYMVGVIGMGLVWLSLDGDGPVWAMVPLYWVWANSHGSFPLGLALTVAILIGRTLDGDDIARAVQVLKWSAIGVLSAVIGPLGFEVLLFPFTALTKSDILREIVEWQPASYESTGQRLFLVLVVVTLLGLVRRGSWALALPAIGLVVAAVLAQRNIVMAVMVLVPVCAACAPAFGSLRVGRRPNLINAYVAVSVVALVGGAAVTLRSEFGSLDSYPQRPLAWLETTESAEENLAAPDIVGNLLSNLDGDEARVFVDDRVDMLPEPLVRDGIELLRGRASWPVILEEHDIELVVWSADRPLRQLVAQDSVWRVVFSDTEWALACRRGPSCDRLG